MVLEYLLGQMEENILGNGKMVSNMGKENIFWQTENQKMENG